MVVVVGPLIRGHSEVVFAFSLYLKEHFTLFQTNRLTTYISQYSICRALNTFPGTCWLHTGMLGKRSTTDRGKAAWPTTFYVVVSEKRSDSLFFSSNAINWFIHWFSKYLLRTYYAKIVWEIGFYELWYVTD